MKISEEQYKLLADRIINEIKQNYYLVERKSAPLLEDKVSFLEYILEFICEEKGLDVIELRNGSRKREYAHACRLYCYMARKFGERKLGYNIIGKFINRDHATMIYSERKLIEEMEVDRRYRQEIKEMEERFNSSRKHKISEIHNPINNDKNSGRP